MYLDPPVTTPDDVDMILKPVHKRMKRVMIPDDVHCCHMRYLLEQFLKKLKPGEILHGELEQERTTQMLNYVCGNSSTPVYEIVVFSHLQHR